jgi:hypothetical protein
LERSSPARVRFAAPNNGAPLTPCGPFQDNTLRGGKGSFQTARRAGAASPPFWRPRRKRRPQMAFRTPDCHRLPQKRWRSTFSVAGR